MRAADLARESGDSSLMEEDEKAWSQLSALIMPFRQIQAFAILFVSNEAQSALKQMGNAFGGGWDVASARLSRTLEALQAGMSALIAAARADLRG